MGDAKSLHTGQIRGNQRWLRNPAILDRTQEVAGSSPASSTKNPLETAGFSWPLFALPALWSPVVSQVVSETVSGELKRVRLVPVGEQRRTEWVRRLLDATAGSHRRRCVRVPT
jgi:hypothetical protein